MSEVKDTRIELACGTQLFAAVEIFGEDVEAVGEVSIWFADEPLISSFVGRLTLFEDRDEGSLRLLTTDEREDLLRQLSLWVDEILWET